MYVRLPSELTEPVPEPQVEVRVWDDVIQLALEMQAALRLANEKLRKIRKTEKPAPSEVD